MYLIVGLGNPGDKYHATRHNMGFDAVDRIVEEYQVPQGGVKFHAVTGTFSVGGEKVLLMKLLTYMNLSGSAVSEAIHFYKLDPKTQLIVISDDVALPPGRIRIRKSGSSGGQKGLEHIIKCLGTDEFIRIRVGVGQKPAEWDMADWVLSRPSGEDRTLIDEALDHAAKAAVMVVTDGADSAMNLYNTKKEPTA